MRHRLDLLTHRRKHRLPRTCYPVGSPVHVTIWTYQKGPMFRSPHLADPLFALVKDHSQTIACCLMPDHLHWLIADASSMGDLVRSFKSYSTYVARTLGYGPRLWQRSYLDHVLRREDLRKTAEYIIQKPVRGGIVYDAREYPYQSIKV